MDRLAKVLHPEQTNPEGSTMKKSAAALSSAEKSFAEELDRRVAQRTAELTAANEQLRKELAEHKRAEEAPREGEINLGLIVNSIPVPVAVTSPTGEVEALNKPTLEYFGRTFEELRAWKSSDVVHPDDLQRTVAAQLEAHETGSAYNVESRHRRADGTYRWFNVLGLPLRDAQGRIRHWFHLQIDIDGRKRAEAQLAGEKRLLEMVASGSPLNDVLFALCRFVEDTAADCKCGIYLIDWSGPKFHTGAAPSMPATFNDALEGLTVEATAGPCGLAALTGSQVIAEDFELDLAWQQSLIRPLALGHGLRAQWSTPICSRDGSVLGTFAIFQDHPSSPTQVQQDLIAQVTHIASIAIERALADEALRSSERNLSLTINTIPTFIQVSRPDGTILSVNQAVLDYHGIALQDVQKEDFRARVYHPDDAERLREERKEALKRPQRFEYEQRALGKDGKYRWFLVRYNPLLDDQGKIDRWYATAFDIEDRKRAEEALRSVEHNLNQIINTIPTHIYVLNTEGSVQYVNQAVMDYTGLSLEDVKQEDYRNRVIHTEDFKRVRAGRAASLRRGAPFSTEQRVLGNDGQYRWFLVRYKPLLDEQGRIVRWYVAAFDIEDRKRAEAAQQSSERSLRQITNVIPTNIHVLRPDGSVLYANQRVLDYTGLTMADVLKDDYRARVFHPEDLARIREERRDSLTRPVLFENEQRALGKDGEYRWFLVRHNPLLNEQGEIERWYVASFDIDDWKRAQEEVRRSEAELRRANEYLTVAQELSQTGSYARDVSTDEQTLSAEMYRIWDFDPAKKVTHEMVLARVHPEDLSIFDEILKTTIPAGKDWEAAYRIVTGDGTVKHVRSFSRRLEEIEDRVVYVGATQDVTEKKLAEEDLRRSEAFLAEAQRLTSIGSFSWRVVADEITWSDELYRIYEFDPGIKITLDIIRTRVHPDDLTLYEKMVGQARNGADDFEWQYRLLMPDQSIKYMHAVAHATRDQNGELEYLAAVRDVTVRRLSDEALDKARSELAHVARVASLGALTASIAHEVNQPLSGIITNASTCVRMLDADPPNVDGALETAKRTIRDGRRAADVITRLRALFVKKEAATELVDLNEATLEVIALSQSELERSRVITRAELADQLPPVTGDRVQLQQVILNLVRNASDAMSTVDDRPRQLLIKTEPEGDQVRLSVQDAGVGFDPQAIKNLFEAFYTTKNDGMGIGLSVSRSIIESHHGRLWATPNDGPGVTFSFSIPGVVEGPVNSSLEH
jgi:PAS domain S-box-containing protein